MVSVGVWIDLHLLAEAGGHVKCWERFAEAAIGLEDELDLTLHFLADRARETTLATNVRYIHHQPRFGTERLPFLKAVAAQTDLAPSNPKLFPYLAQHDVNHTTHQLFTFGQTALRFSKRHHKPLVSSIHTDVPKYTEIYTRKILHRYLRLDQYGSSKLGQFVVDRWRIPQRTRQIMERRLSHYWPHCKHTLISQPSDYAQVTQVVSPSRVSYLRRGMDKTLFHPNKRDRHKLQQHYTIDPEIPLLAYVGRLTPDKSVMTLACAVRHLLDRGIRLHTIFAGQGSSSAEIQHLLGSAATLTGTLDHQTLAWIYASADLFVFPSETEVYGNVVVEAKACGLPILLSNQGGTCQWLQGEGLDGYLVPDNDPLEWAETIANVIAHPEKLKAMGQVARKHIELEWPSWRNVLEQDLLTVWKAVA